MGVNSVTSGQTAALYNVYDNSAVKNEDKTVDNKAQTSGVVYEKSAENAVDSKAPYSINKMSKEDRANLVKQLKDDQANREKSLMNLVQNMMTGQGKTFAIATNSDDVWKLFADGNFTVDEAAKKQAQEDISEDGYWGVKQTSQRLFDFASALAGDDVDTMKAMQKAMEKGFSEATKAWGKKLPEISQNTKDAANKLFEEYYKSKTEATQ